MPPLEPAAEPDPSGAVDLSILAFPLLAGVLPPRPPAHLDPVLDAAARCLAAHGVARTSVRDIARELGVAPSTVYRKVRSVDNVAWLVAARSVHDLFDRLPTIVAGTRGAARLTASLAAGIEAAHADPVFAKVVRDEPEFVGRTLVRSGPVVEAAAAALGPMLAAAMDAGEIRRSDPGALAHWLIRVAGALLLAPPPGEVRELLDSYLLPTLEGAAARGGAT